MIVLYFAIRPTSRTPGVQRSAAATQATPHKPLLDPQMRYQFMPQTVPSYSATEYFNNLHKAFNDYSYKEATLNPTNPRDRAVDWEVDVVNHNVTSLGYATNRVRAAE